MTKRIYLCPIIGIGTEDDPQRAAIVDVSDVTRCRAVISVHLDSGLKRFDWTICLVEAVDWVGVDAISGAVHIPLDAPDTVIPPAKRAALLARVSRDVAIPVEITVRRVLRRLVRAHYPHADEEAILS